MKTIKSLSIVASLAVVSNLLAYIRDASLAANYGASSVTDAYFAAFFVPNTLYLILISGSIANTFLPIFVEYLEKDTQEAWHIANSVFNAIALMLGFAVLVSILTVQFWMPALFPGYANSTGRLAIDLSFVLLPMLLFIGLSSLITAMLNAFEHFKVPALAPSISNIITIVAILLSVQLGGIYGVAVGVVIGMGAQLFVQIPVLVRLGGRYQLVMNLQHPAVRRIGKLALPLVAYFGVSYASVVIERMIASSFSEGTVSAFNYALRLFVLPVNLVAGSLGIVLYPRFSRLAVDDYQTLGKILSQTLKGAILVLTPVSLWLLLNSDSLVGLFYGHGQFTSEDVQLTAGILSAYAIGMTPMGVTSIFYRVFYALQNTNTPFFIELFNLLIYFCMALGLSNLLGPIGLAMARSGSFIIVALMAFGLLHKFYGLMSLNNKLFLRLGQYMMICLIATAIWGMPLLVTWGHAVVMSNEARIVVTSISGGVGLFVYLMLILLFNVGNVRMAKDSFILYVSRRFAPSQTQ